VRKGVSTLYARLPTTNLQTTRGTPTVPTYEYHCPTCARNFDVVQGFHDDPIEACPTCGSPVRKVFGNVGIVFKGSGFYKTDSRTSGNGAKKSTTETDTPAAAPAADVPVGGGSGTNGAGAKDTGGTGNGTGGAAPAKAGAASGTGSSGGGSPSTGSGSSSGSSPSGSSSS